MAWIYIIKNEIDSKAYVGKTKRCVSLRFKEHLKDVRNGSRSHLSNAIRKHGAENFKVEVLEEVDLHELNAREIHFIECLKSEYNMTRGGEGAVFTAPRMWITDGTQQRLVDASSKIPEGFRRGMSNSAKANLAMARKGRKHSESTKQKMSITQTLAQIESPYRSRGK